MKKMKCFIFILWIGLLGMSCSDETNKFEEPEIRQEKVTVRLVVSHSHSGNNSNLQIRGTGDLETDINEVQLLVFEEGAYKYRVPGISITNTGTVTTFDARLLASDKVLDLYIVANATASILDNEPNVDDSVDEVKKKLHMLFPVNASFSFIPMFGHYSLPQGIEANQLKQIGGIQMLRAIARVDVLVDMVPEFELTSVQAYRANDHIQLISDQDLLSVTLPSVPANSRANVNTEAILVMGNQSVSQLYLSEAAVPAEAERVTSATCIVVGGKYGGSQDITYYRIDFDPDNTNNSFGQVLRNHRYIFTIRSVAGPGWPTADEAANNRSAQINAEVKAWDETTGDMNFDTEHHFGVSTREIVLGNKQNAVSVVQVNTDIPVYTLQWSDEQGNVSGTASEILSNSFFKVEKTNNGNKLVVTALQANDDNKMERTGYFVITANRWQILMTIRQKYTSSGRMINLLSFGNSLGDLGVNLLLPKYSADSRGAGTRGILDNLKNFGPSGTVECLGINMLRTNASSNTLSDASLAVADIIYFNYVSAFTNQDALFIRRWLEGNPRRVMILSYDGSSINIPILTEFLGTTQHITWAASNKGPYPLVGKSASNFFTDLGPFTVSPYTPVAAEFSFQNYDAYHGEIGGESAAGITPILNGPGGGIVLGVDVSRRIIYMGDVDLNIASNGIGATSANHINNTTGNINNDAAKLIANVFAWAVGIVTGE